MNMENNRVVVCSEACGCDKVKAQRLPGAIL